MRTSTTALLAFVSITTLVSCAAAVTQQGPRPFCEVGQLVLPGEILDSAALVRNRVTGQEARIPIYAGDTLCLRKATRRRSGSEQLPLPRQADPQA